jgi:hypothetical protein
MNRKRVILAALIGVLALSMIYAYMASPRLQKAPPRAARETSKSGSAVAQKTQADRGSRIDFSYLERNREEYPEAKRNIFAFGSQPSVAKPSRPVVQPVAPEPEEKVVEEFIPARPEPPIETVQRSLGQFTFLGFLDKAGEKTVFLSSGGDLFLVKQGETFGTEQEFKVNAIEGNLLKVNHSGVAGLIEVPLIEQKKLSAAVSKPARLPAQPVQPPVMNNRVFRPQKSNRGKPFNPFETEKTLPELIEEYSSEEGQEQEPVESGVLEGEVNGTNQ